MTNPLSEPDGPWNELMGRVFGPGDRGAPLVLVEASFLRGSMLSLENGLEVPATIFKVTGRAGDLRDPSGDTTFTVALNDTQMLYLSLMFLTEYGKRMLPETPMEAPDE